MNKALRVPDYLGHILQAIKRIGRYTEDLDETGFLNSDLVQDAVIRNIEIIGEAANNIQASSRNLPRFTAIFLGGSCMRCAIAFPMGTTRSTWKSSGR